MKERDSPGEEEMTSSMVQSGRQGLTMVTDSGGNHLQTRSRF